MTGFFEPEVDARLQPSLAFPVPLLAPPHGLREIGADEDRRNLDPSLTWALEDGQGRLAPCPNRRAIMAGALDGRARPRSPMWQVPSRPSSSTCRRGAASSAGWRSSEGHLRGEKRTPVFSGGAPDARTRHRDEPVRSHRRRAALVARRIGPAGQACGTRPQSFLHLLPRGTGRRSRLARSPRRVSH